MSVEKQQLQFERNPCTRYRDDCDTDNRTDDGPTTDEFPFHVLC